MKYYSPFIIRINHFDLVIYHYIIDGIILLIKLIVIISPMYSKYLDYTETAVRAHQAVQIENDQKDILIGQLKSEAFELRQLEGDYLRLNDLIASL